MNKLKFICLLTILLILSGCSSLSWMKFWGDEEEVGPAKLVLIESSIDLLEDWSSNFGSENNFGRLIPSVYEEKIFFVSSEGYLASIDSKTGSTLWSIDKGDSVSGAITVNFKTITYGTLDGHLVALDYEDGAELWRSQTSSEVLVPPVNNGNMVVAQTGDGRIAGYDFKTGERQWFHQTILPKLTLRGTSIPFIDQGFIFAGFANGKIAMLYPDSGAVRLEIPITINEGKSELERIIDIDGKSLITNDLLISATYQGNITAISLREGRPVWQEELSTVKDLASNGNRVVAVSEDDTVKAFGTATGALIWEQSGLKLRKLSSPVSINNYIVVGDFEGYVHLLNVQNGKFEGRKRISRQPIKEITSERNYLLVVDEAGKLFRISLN
ncbi:MAG TPA: outer membrane protein assembly factor BamB [SAR86 cluster bacterium]|nr:outer membrane protein assembly factor BamB [SAR86 cluster bacterium]